MGHPEKTGVIYRHDVVPSPQQIRSDRSMGEQDPYNCVVSGKVGMWIASFTEQGSRAQLNLCWGIAPLSRDAQAATQALSWGHAIASDAVAPDVCWERIGFPGERMPERLAPGRIVLAESKEQGRLTAAGVGRMSLEETPLMPGEALWGWDDGRTGQTFETVMRKIADETATVQEALSAAQEVAE